MTPKMRLPNLTDYSYGLAMPEITVQLYGDQFQIGCVMHNAADGPMRALIEAYEAKAHGCIRSEAEEPARKPSIIARGMHTMAWAPILKRVSAVPTPTISGSVSLTAKYGHPDWEYVRRAFIVYKFQIVVGQQTKIVPALEDHREEPIEISLQS